MASLQHHLLKFTLSNISNRWERKYEDVSALRKMLDVSAKLLYLPSGITLSEVQIGRIKGELYQAKNFATDKIILYLHGGGYSVGSINTHRSIAAKLAANTKSQCLIIRYRLAPEYPFPAALEDVVTAYKWLLEKGYNASNIAFAGDSAGGGLCLTSQISLRELNIPRPAACICMSPWVDLTQSKEEAFMHKNQDPIVPVDELPQWAGLYAAETSLEHPLISPIFADLSNLAPLLIQTSTTEILTEQSLRLEKKVLDAGGHVTLDLWPNMLHVWQVMWQFIPEGEQALEKAAQFVLKHWDKELAA